MKNILAKKVHWALYRAILSNMTLRQRACYRIAHYVIVNNVKLVAFESKMKKAWKATDRREIKRLKSLYLDISDFFKAGSSKLNNHSAMTVGKFILSL